MTARATKRGRVRSSRPTYRRGGLKLGSADWTVFTADQLAPGGLIALLEDPVVAFQIELEDEAGVRWSSPSTAERLHLATVLRDELTDAEAGGGQDRDAAAEGLSSSGEPTFTLAAAFGDDFAGALADEVARQSISTTTGAAATPPAPGAGDASPPPMQAAPPAEPRPGNASAVKPRPKREPKPKGGKAKA